MLGESDICPICKREFVKPNVNVEIETQIKQGIKNEYKEYKNHIVIYTIDKKNNKVIDTKVSKDDFYSKLKDFDINWFPLWNEDMQDYYIGYTLYINKDGKRKPKTILLHRFLMDAKAGEYVDHKNHNIRDNRRNNLQLTSNDENLTNRKGKNINNKSGYRNVFWSTARSMWCVSLCRNYKTIIIGYYNDVHEAGKVAEEARKKYYGKFAGAS
jgi:hypothetical protein